MHASPFHRNSLTPSLLEEVRQQTGEPAELLPSIITLMVLRQTVTPWAAGEAHVYVSSEALSPPPNAPRVLVLWHFYHWIQLHCCCELLRLFGLRKPLKRKRVFWEPSNPRWVAALKSSWCFWSGQSPLFLSRPALYSRGHYSSLQDKYTWVCVCCATEQLHGQTGYFLEWILFRACIFILKHRRAWLTGSSEWGVICLHIFFFLLYAADSNIH